VVRILAQDLGPQGFGQYYTMFALILVVQLIVEAGVGTVLTRRLVQARETWRATAADGQALFLIITLASAAAFLVLGGGWTWWWDDASTWPCWIAAALACAALQV